MSPIGYIAFTRSGADANPFAFTARMVDKQGDSLPIPAGGLAWTLRPGRAFRIDADSVTRNRQAATAVVRPVEGGRELLVASHGTAADTAFAENWEWVAPSFQWEGDPWTPAGDSRCVRVRQDGSTEVDLALFDIYATSFNPSAVRVDSASMVQSNRSVRICFTARRSGATIVGIVGRDAVNHRYWGWHRKHVVLTPPLSLSFEHGERYEIGVGQRTELNVRVQDGHGASVFVGDDTSAVSWTSGDTAVATVNATGAVVGVGSGVVGVRAAYRNLTRRAVVDVYEITGGRVGEEIVCISTRRGAVRCWGNSDEAMLGYAVGEAEMIVRPVQVANVDMGASVRAVFNASVRGACAITVSAELRCWGNPNWGSLGYGNTRQFGQYVAPRTAGPVPLGGTPAYVGGGPADHFCTVLVSGGLRCVGSNLAGQVGYGVSYAANRVVGDNETPARMGDVPLGGRAVHVATGGRAGMTCAALENGRGRCWGINANDWVPATATLDVPTYGLGYGRAHGYDSPIGDDETPADVGDLPVEGRIVQFALGGFHICALLEGNSVRCWGSNSNGKLGAGPGEREHVADAAESVELVFPHPVVQIQAGWQHTCVLMETGAVRCWGANYYGALGLGDTRGRGTTESVEFVEDVPLGGPAARLLGSGQYENCVVMRAGGLRCWGANWNGHFGYPFRENVGDNEFPADVGDIMVFPGPVPARRLGTTNLPARAFGAPSPVDDAPAAVALPLPKPDPLPSVLVIDWKEWNAPGAATRPDAADGSPSGPEPGRLQPWVGPLIGDGGWIAPSAAPASTAWIKVARR